MFKKILVIIIGLVFVMAINTNGWAEEEGIILAQKEEVKKEEEKKEKKEKKYELKEVKVKAEKEETPVENPLLPAPSSRMTTTTITKEEIEAQHSKTVMDAMEFTPGASIHSSDRKYRKSITFRGESAEVLLNGSRLVDTRSLYTLSASNIEKIEINRNSSSLIYGSSGLGGVVNIITKEPEEFASTLTVEGGTNDSEFYRVDTGGRLLKGKLGFFLSAQKDRYKGRSGDNTFNDMANFNGSLSYYFDDGSKVNINVTREEGHFITSDYYRDYPEGYHLLTGMTFDPWKTTNAGVTILKKWGKNISTYINPYSHRRTLRCKSVRLRGGEIRKYDSFVEDNAWGVNFRQTFKFFDINTLRVGGQYDHWLAPHGKLYYVGTRNDTERYAGFLQDEISLFDGKLELDGGVRWEQRHKNRYGAYWGRKVSYSDVWDKHFTNYGFGVVYHFTPKFSSSFRFGTGTLPKGDRATRSGEPLDDEERKKYDLGFEYLWSEYLSTRLTFFWVDQNNGIESDGYVTLPSGEFLDVYKNVDFRRKGFELELIGKITSNLRYFANYAFQYRENRTEDERDKGKPQHISSFGLRYDDGRIQANLTGKSESLAESSQGPYPTTRNKDYFRLNANIGYLFKYRGIENKIYINFRNITDDEWQEHSAYTEYGSTILMGYSAKF